MRNLFGVLLICIISMFIVGCSGSEEEVQNFGDKICADNGQKAADYILGGTFAEFIARLTYPSMKQNMNILMEAISLEDYIEMQQEQLKEYAGDEEPDFESCTHEEEAIDCTDAFDEIARNEMLRDIENAELMVYKVADDMGIEECGKIDIKIKEKGGDEEEYRLFVANIDQEYKVFFMIE